MAAEAGILKAMQAWSKAQDPNPVTPPSIWLRGCTIPSNPSCPGMPYEGLVPGSFENDKDVAQSNLVKKPTVTVLRPLSSMRARTMDFCPFDESYMAVDPRQLQAHGCHVGVKRNFSRRSLKATPVDASNQTQY